MKCLVCCGPAPVSSSKGGMEDTSGARELFAELEKELQSKLSERGEVIWRNLSCEFDRLRKNDVRGDIEQNEELAAANGRIRQLQQSLDALREENLSLKDRVSRMPLEGDVVPKSYGGLEAPAEQEHDMPSAKSTSEWIRTSKDCDERASKTSKVGSSQQDGSEMDILGIPSAIIQSGTPSPPRNKDVIAVGTASASTRVRVLRSRTHIKRLFHSQAFLIVSAVCLAIALFGERLYVILNIPDDPGNYILDAVLSTIMLIFFFEICATYFIDHRYRWSFFFWMDILGTVSMIFEVSFLLGSLEVDTVVLRTTRVAKLGARLGRLLKLLKFFLKRPDENRMAKAKVLTGNVTFSLATRVSALTIVLLCTLPLFSLPVYPTEDLSLVGWAQWLEDVHAWDGQCSGGTSLVDSALSQLQSFYEDYNYAPFKITGYNFVHQFGRDEPDRENNIIEEKVKNCLNSNLCASGMKPSISFDFTGSNQLAACMDITLIIYIMVMMVVMTSVQIYTIDQMLVKPLERMLYTVRVHAREICDRFVEVHGGTMVHKDLTTEAGDVEQKEQESSELELLESVLRKIARLVEVHTSNNRMFAHELNGMDHADQAVLIDIMDTKVVKPSTRPKRRSTQSTSDGNTKAFRDLLAFTEQSSTWTLDVLQEGDEKLLDLVMHFFYVHEIGCACDLFVTTKTLKEFVRVVQAGYNDLPYHCFRHAIDVLHCVSLVLTKVQAHLWMSEAEVYAMMVAALAHDVGHGGKTNQFLVEVKDQLALRYNDKSPLENMHCATLFQICTNSETDALANASDEDRKEIRKVCIAAILHTDNAGHFQMVKEITGMYELEKELCDLQASSKVVLERYELEILHKDKYKWLELWLHLADVSNPCKPFPICQAWAWRVLDEFFAQGDEEKRLGLPVGMLNDRNTVNRPGSQHGFINFLIAPLVATTVRIFPALQELHWQLACNLEEWRNIWVKDCSPSSEEVSKKDADVKKIKDVAVELKNRNIL